MAKKTTKTTKKTEKVNKKKTSPSKKKSTSVDDDDEDMSAHTRAQAEKSKNKYGSQLFNLPDGTEQFKPKKKTYNLDHLPYRITDKKHPSGREKGKLWYERTFYMHFNVGPEDKPVICPTSIGKPCPVCEEYKRLSKSGDESDSKEADRIKKKERQMFNIIDTDDQDKGVQFFEYSTFNYGDIIDEEIRESEDDSGYARFANLKGGFTLEVRFIEAKMGSNKYIKASRVDFNEREDYDKDILDDVINLDEVLVVKSYDELAALIEGGDDDEEDEEEKPRNKKKDKKQSSKKKRDEDEDDEDVDEEDEDEEDEEDESEDEEDESDDDEDDDDADEDEDEPKKKKGSKKSSGRKKTDKKSTKSSGKKNTGKKKKGSKGKKCPAGGTFGEDCNEYEECDDCDYWVDCQELTDS